MRQKIVRILAFIGLGLFIYILLKLDPRYIWQIIQKMSWQNFLILFSLRLVFWLIRALNWQIILSRYESRIPLWHLLRARLAGHAVGSLTPSSKIGGEAFKVLMVESAPPKKVLASAVVDKTIELLATILLVVIGVAIALIKIPMSGGQRLVFISLAAVVVLSGAFILKKQKKGLFIWLIDLLKKVKLKFKFLEKNRQKIRETDAYISDFYAHHHKIFPGVFILYVMMILWWTGEIYVNFLFIGTGHITFLDSFLLITLGSFAYLLPGLPASLGIYEVTYLSLFTLLGIPMDFGVALVIFRRILGFLWAGVGLIPMLRRRKSRLLTQYTQPD
jgi:uncharacterized protein (TIRG00374 family)